MATATAPRRPKTTHDGPMPTGRNPRKTAKRLSELNGNGKAHASDVEADEVISIPLEKLVNHPVNPDPAENEILKMMEWLDGDLGQLEPLTVRQGPYAGPPYKGPIRSIVPFEELPTGLYQILAGKTRYMAAKRLGWDGLACRVRRDLKTESAAIEVLAGTNQQRRTETPIRQALMIQAMIDAGQSLVEAGTMYDLKTESAVRNKLQLLKLPDVWQQRIISGEMPESAARQLVPYVDHAKLMTAFDKDCKRALKSKWPRDRVAWSSRDGAERSIGSVLDDNTRPMDDGVKHRYSYPIWGEWPRLFAEDATDAKKLQTVELPTGKNGKLQRHALNVRLYDKLNKPLIKKAQKAEEARRSSPAKKKKKGSAKPSAAALKAEAARKKKEAAKKTAEQVKVWRHRFLRCLIFDAIKSGSWETSMLLPVVMTEVRKRRNEFGLDPAPLDEYLEAAATMSARENDRCPTFKAGPSMAMMTTLITKDKRKDEVAAVEDLQMSLLKFLIWPQCEARPQHLASVLSTEVPHAWRKVAFKDRSKFVFLLDLDYSVVEQIAKLLKVKTSDGWKRSGITNSRERQLVEQFFELHTRDQLYDLAKEIGKGTAAVLDVENAKNKSDAVAYLMRAHTNKKPLKIPKAIEAVAHKKTAPTSRRGHRR